MNKFRDEAVDFIFDVAGKVPDSEVLKTIICPHFLLLRSMVVRQGDNLRIGAQNMHFEKSGAFTGEVSPTMLADLNAEYVLIGHSERRKYFHESNEYCNRKVLAAFENGLIPVLCVGENAEQREADVTMNIIEKQIKIALEGVTAAQVLNTVIAYEPLWAIGTGKVATPEQAQEVVRKIREFLEDRYTRAIADQTSILYGGSVTPNNLEKLYSLDDVDGFLVGGASLDSESFLKMADLMVNK